MPNQWTEQKTIVLPAYRTIGMAGDCGPLVHVTPEGYHLVDFDCDGVCLVCLKPLTGQS